MFNCTSQKSETRPGKSYPEYSNKADSGVKQTEVLDYRLIRKARVDNHMPLTRFVCGRFLVCEHVTKPGLCEIIIFR